MIKKWLPLVIIVLLALALRLVNLGERSLWYDEAFTVLMADAGWDAMLQGTLGTAAHQGAAEAHPLLFYVTLNGWMQVSGQSPFAVRLWSVVLGMATVVVVYLIARDLFNQHVATLAGGIAAVAPFHVQYSQETRMYIMLGLFSMLATWCFVRGWQAGSTRRGWIWWILFGVMASLAMYSQQLASFYLIALALIPVMARRRDMIIRVFVGGIIALVIYFPWLVNLPSQLGKMRSLIWLEPANLARPLRTLQAFMVVNLDIPPTLFMATLTTALVIIVLMIVQIVFYVRRRRARKPDQNALLFVLWLAAGPPAMLWLASQVQPLYLERGLLPSAVMLYVGLAWFFMRSGLPRPIAGILGIIGILMAATGLYFQYTWNTFPNSPYQSGATYIRDNWQAGDVVVSQNKLIGIPLIYYARDLDQHFIRDVPGSPQDTFALPTQDALQLFADDCVQSAAAGGSRLWWVNYDFAAEQFANAGRTELKEQLDWLNANYTLTDTQTFNDLEVSLFTDPQTEDRTCIAS